MAEEKQEVPVEETEEDVEEVVEVSLEDQIALLQNEVEKWKNDYYKVFADMENTKRRMQTEHSNAMKFMLQGTFEEMLPILDNFSRSLNVSESSEELNNFLKGYEMIYKQLLNVLNNQGLEEIDVKDKEFDPNYHQAVATEKVEGLAPNMIIEELQKGYMLKGRVIRASLVKVSE